MILKATALTLTTALALAGCTYNTGAPNRPVNGVLLGATTGAVKINLQVLRADDNMHRRAIGMARREVVIANAYFFPG